MFHATNTIENINSAVMYTASEFRNACLWLLRLLSRLKVLILNFNSWLLLYWLLLRIKRLSNVLVILITILAIILEEVSFTLFNSHQSILASLI